MCVCVCMCVCVQVIWAMDKRKHVFTAGVPRCCLLQEKIERKLTNKRKVLVFLPFLVKSVALPQIWENTPLRIFHKLVIFTSQRAHLFSCLPCRHLKVRKTLADHLAASLLKKANLAEKQKKYEVQYVLVTYSVVFLFGEERFSL